MDIVKGKWKRNLFLQAWERCRSLGRVSSSKRSSLSSPSLTKSRSWPPNCNSTSEEEGEREKNKKKNKKKKSKCQVAPEGCFSVYVGPERQRFVVKTEFTNHPLFKMLLEDAELEYGFNSEGPILLPCDVDLFYKVLAEMEDGGGDGEEIISSSPSWNPLFLCSPRRPSNYSSVMNTGSYGGGYRLLSPSRLLKLNRF